MLFTLVFTGLCRYQLTLSREDEGSFALMEGEAWCRRSRPLANCSDHLILLQVSLRGSILSDSALGLGS